MFFTKKRGAVHFYDRITILSRSKVFFEGIERIVLCHSETMILEKKGRILVEGKDLNLKELGNDNVSISGKILALRFEEKQA